MASSLLLQKCLFNHYTDKCWKAVNLFLRAVNCELTRAYVLTARKKKIAKFVIPALFIRSIWLWWWWWHIEITLVVVWRILAKKVVGKSESIGNEHIGDICKNASHQVFLLMDQTLKPAMVQIFFSFGYFSPKNLMEMCE